MNNRVSIGKVTLAGAGPGDPELITLKTLRRLQEADVVLADRLVSGEILNLYVRPRAEIIYVGKQCGSAFSTPQSAINTLMVQHAQQGRKVVRLKGGDVSIFANLLDELKVLVDHHIPYEIIPGVSAALGAAAYAGIPLTARGYANSVRFVTSYRSDTLSENYWKELADTDDTLVFYMSADRLAVVADRLLHHNVSPEKLLAVIAQATTPEQTVRVFELVNYAQQRPVEEGSPTLAIVGRVVSLHEQFGWIANNASPKQYFHAPARVKNNGYAS